ncbi:unnamed protein product [Adineta ricciae]|uniref:Carboxypeptidase n=1 Tax=Adineta ricciae TaxID=249248 RepID=A0A813YDE1_ADIRI|nr:unnamed protein product [Adineta ricciae]CAF1488915.1 unnamed protein product [Adineta ricciae]
MLLFFIGLCVFEFTNSHLNFPHTKYRNSFNVSRSKSSSDYLTLRQHTESFFKPRFINPKAQDFYVNGSTIPEVNFDVGPSWAGLLPISNKTNESQQLFFWYFPSQSTEGINDLVIWLNGGPGCSSMEGLLQENGPFLWQWGTAHPVRNPYAWNTLANVLWIEQPVGTGFSQGNVTIHDEDELAEQLYGFLTQFFDVFMEIKNNLVYLAGESYAGYFVPYIANYIYSLPETAPLRLNLQGILIFDPLITSSLVQLEIPAVSFAHMHQNIFNFNASFLSYLDGQNKKCGYENYTQTYATYPPHGPLPIPSSSHTNECDIWATIFEAALRINPAFNIYRITDTPPILWDVLGFPGSFGNKQSPLYFARSDVQQAIHAPKINWTECAHTPVFVDDIDRSPPPINSVLPNVIEKSQRSIIVNGEHDFIIIAEGTRIAIQNMTWHGMQGFQMEPKTRFIVPEQGDLGFFHTERNLTYVELVLCGHMGPQFQPRASLQILQYLLGRIHSW